MSVFQRKSAFRLIMIASLMVLFQAVPISAAQSYVPDAGAKKLCRLYKEKNATEDAKLKAYKAGVRGKEFSKILEKAWDAKQRFDAYQLAYWKNRPMSERDGFWPWCLNKKPTRSINDVMGMKFGKPVSGPVKNTVTITVYMPKKGVYQKVQALIFGPAFPKFKKARVTGSVIWETLFYKGYAKFQTIKLVLWQNGKPVRRRVTKTDRFGGYSLEMPVNAKGSTGLRTFKKELTRRLSEGYAPPEYWTVPGANSAGKVDPSLKKKLPTTKDWKKSFWNAASKLKAIQKDYDYQKHGGVGTPNVDQWTRNHKAGRDNINALTLFIDLATAPATATAQIFENANITWKRLTGKPLPFVKSKGKVIKNAMKNGVGFFGYVKRLKKYTEAGQ